MLAPFLYLAATMAAVASVMLGMVAFRRPRLADRVVNERAWMAAAVTVFVMVYTTNATLQDLGAIDGDTSRVINRLGVICLGLIASLWAVLYWRRWFR